MCINCLRKGAFSCTERSASPLIGALGGEIGEIAAALQCQHGVDLRCEATITTLEGDARGRVRRAHFSGKSTLDVDVVVAALGAVRNNELRATFLETSPTTPSAALVNA